MPVCSRAYSRASVIQRHKCLMLSGYMPWLIIGDESLRLLLTRTATVRSLVSWHPINETRKP